MDCCNFPEYRGQYGWEYGAGGYAPYAAPLPYAPYAGYYAPHEPYARYPYHYDYPQHHVAAPAHAVAMDYGGYVSKEARARRALVRREAERARSRTPAHHLPLPPTPPLDCGGRPGTAFCEPQMPWPHYQMGVMGGMGWGAAEGAGGGWGAHCARDAPRRFPAAPAHDHRHLKGSSLSMLNQMCAPDSRSTSASFNPYEKPMFAPCASSPPRPRSRVGGEYPPAPDYCGLPDRRTRSPRGPRVEPEPPPEPRREPPVEKRPRPVVPLPAFQQAFGSTEIGRFAEAFSRAEAAHEADPNDLFPEWDGAPEPAWPPAPAREIKCEDTY